MSHEDVSAPPSTPLVTPAVGRLVGTLLTVHFSQWTLFTAEAMQGVFAFQRGDLDAGRWWSVATYSFVQPSGLMLGLNVYMLLVFGPRLERDWGARRFVGFAALAALGGWIVHLFVGGTSLLLGASAAGLGVLGAYALRWGSEERALPAGFTARVRWLAAMVAAIVLLTGLGEPVGGGVPFLAHLGGLGTAWVFSRATRVSLVERFREGVSAMPDEPPEDQPPRAVPKTLPRSRAQRESIDDVVARANADAARRSTPTRRRPQPRPPEDTAPPPAGLITLDAILDKISAEGLDRLTPDERRFLDEHSRKLRDN